MQKKHIIVRDLFIMGRCAMIFLRGEESGSELYERKCLCLFYQVLRNVICMAMKSCNISKRIIPILL